MSENRDDKESVVDSLSTVISGGALVSITKLFALGFGFFTQVLMARLLTETNYGSVVLALAVVNIAGLVAKLGLDDGVMREYPHHEDNPARAKGVIRASTVIAIISGLVVAVVVFLSAPLLARRIFDDTSLIPLLRIASAGIPFITVSSVLVSLARGARDASVHAYVRQFVQPGSRLALVGGLIFAGFGAAGAVVGQIGSVIVGTLAAVYLVRRSLPTFDVPPARMYRPVLAFSIPLIAVQGMGFLNTNVDVYMVGYFLSSASLGKYNIALQLGNLVTAALATASFLLPPMLTRLEKEGKTTEMRRTYQVITKWVVVLILPVFVVLFFAPKLSIGLLFGDNYADGARALQILLVGKLVAIIMGLNSQSLIALGENRIVSYIVFCQTVVNVVVNYLLIPIVGFDGAAIGMTTSIIIGDIIGVAVLYRRFNVHPFTKSVLSPVAAVGAVALVGYGALSLFTIPTYWVVPLVGVAYLPIVVMFAPEPEDERLLARVEERTGYDFSALRSAVYALQ